MRVVEADLTWTGERFEAGVQISIGDDGRIQAIGPLGRNATLRLTRRAILPGFVNVHSHAFQVGLRGRTERFPRGAGTFWSWRDKMYALAESLDPDRARALYVRAFREMRDAGITTCGEFHYLHHAGNDTDYGFDPVVLEAARASGIRLVLLNAFYTTGAIGRTLQGAQRRFESKSAAAYWTQMDRLAGQCDTRQSLGVVAHSIRAAPIEEIAALHAEARRRRLPFHMHVEEQRGEIEESLATYGRRPMALLTERLQISGNLTAVHCTHTDSGDMARFLEAGGTVCVCPLTEGNLGDGLPALEQVGGPALSVGTDSNARISLLEELRWLEYGQRLRRMQRGALTDPAGKVGVSLLGVATAAGSRVLGVEAGSLEPGRWADFVAVDLDAPELAELGPDDLLDGLVFGAGNEVIWGTAVAGDWRQTRAEGAPRP